MMDHGSAEPSSSSAFQVKVQGQSEEKRHSAEWQGFNTNIKIHSKFNGLLKLSKRLLKFTELVIKAKAPIPKLREALTKMDKIQPDEVRKLIDLTFIEQLLTNKEAEEPQLTKYNRDDIVLCLFMAARIVAFEIIEEGKQEASGFDGFKQIYNLVKTWSSFVKIIACLSKMTTFAHLDQYTDYCTKFRETLKYIKEHQNENNSRCKEMIHFLKQSQKNAHQQWSRPDSFKSQLNLLIARLKHLELEQCTARELNHSQARSEIKNVFGIYKMGLFGLLVGGNWVSVKVAIKLRDVVQGMKEQNQNNHLNGLAIQSIESVESEPNESNNQPNEEPTIESTIFELVHLDQFVQLNEFEQKVREIDHELEAFDEELIQAESEIEHSNSDGDVAESVEVQVQEQQMTGPNDHDSSNRNVAQPHVYTAPNWTLETDSIKKFQI